MTEQMDEKLKKNLREITNCDCGEGACAIVSRIAQAFKDAGYIKSQPVPASLEQGIKDILYEGRDSYGDSGVLVTFADVNTVVGKLSSLLHPAISPQEGELVDINKILNQVWQGSKSKGTHEIPDGEGGSINCSPTPC